METSTQSLSDGAIRLVTYMGGLHGEYGKCVPGNKTMAAHFRVAVRTVQRWKRELEAAGRIEQKRRCRSSAEGRVVHFEPSDEAPHCPRHHREMRSEYHIVPAAEKCRPRTRADNARNAQMSPPNVIPSHPLRGASCSYEQKQRTETPATGQKSPDRNAAKTSKEAKTQKPEVRQEEIDEVRQDWHEISIDRLAILLLLTALKRRNASYSEFRGDAHRRVREYAPLNVPGYLIHLAKSGEFFASPPEDPMDQFERELFSKAVARGA